MADNFSLWLAKPNMWVKSDRRIYDNWQRIARYEEGDAPRKIAGPFQEPAEAADLAEDALLKFGEPGQSYCELRFNGDDEPHTVIFLLEREGRRNATYGVWNTPTSKWPIFYADENPYAEMLDGYPEGFIPEDEAEESEETEEADSLDLSEPETEEPDETEGDDADDSEEDDPGDGDEDPNEDEINTDDEDENDDEGEAESDDEDGEDEDEPEPDEEETEMPRLKIFAKMRGPKGWRKRAEAEELMERNVFALKVGVLDAEAETPGKQEANLVAHVEFIEADENRKGGTLRMKLPDGVSPESFTQLKSGWITCEIPYVAEDK